jgi:hypothetical protein
MHKLLLKFLNEKVIEQKKGVKNIFEEKIDLQIVLNTWPIFLMEQGMLENKNFSHISIEENRVVCLGEKGDSILLGTIKEV